MTIKKTATRLSSLIPDINTFFLLHTHFFSLLVYHVPILSCNPTIYTLCTVSTWGTVYYLKQFALPADKEIKTFSKGMKMKLSIAAALSHDPKLLILDEATSGLDPVMRDDILDVFLDFVQDENHSILMSSHITTDLEKVADYIAFLHNGKIIFDKEKDELIYRYGIIRCSSSQFEKLDKEDILACRKKDYQWDVLVADREKAARRYKDFVIDNATIDDILLLYVKGDVLS